MRRVLCVLVATLGGISLAGGASAQDAGMTPPTAAAMTAPADLQLADLMHRLGDADPCR